MHIVSIWELCTAVHSWACRFNSSMIILMEIPNYQHLPQPVCSMFFFPETTV